MLCLSQLVTYRAQPFLPMSLACMRIQLRRPACLRHSYCPRKRNLGPGSCRLSMHASNFTTCNLLHCRKPVWAKLKTTAYEGLTGKMYTPLPATAAQACLQLRSLGVAKLRLLPKKTGQSHAKPGTLTLSSYCLCPHMKHMLLTQLTHLDLITHASLGITPGVGSGNCQLTVLLASAP